MRKPIAIAVALALLAAVQPAQSTAVDPVAHNYQRVPAQRRETARAQLHEHLSQARELAKPRPMIGVRLAPVDDAVAAQLPRELMPAVLLTSIFEGSPAERAGLLPNDVITAIDGNSDVTVESLVKAISSKQPGSTVTLDVSRAGRNQIVNVTIEEFAPPARERAIPKLEFWNDYNGDHPWPRFGVTPDGKIMVQKEDGDGWAKTDVTTDLKKSLGYLRQGNKMIEGQPYLDLTKPDADPDGSLRRHLDALRELHTEHRGRVDAHSLETRIDELERKVDDIHRMLEELLKRSK